MNDQFGRYSRERSLRHIDSTTQDATPQRQPLKSGEISDFNMPNRNIRSSQSDQADSASGFSGVSF
ncbi:hypothetical protein Pan189_22320 [Stratiformator vulcanicus]|uniref:Uncharacterized protein n=1 Tax=Stratiformator vulcanicus TaxID=2527980 RepID=A0A517R1U7_9PLAN|nr:hypothetical protein Pan189_22320 [Stratiformator vulcanicus]